MVEIVNDTDILVPNDLLGKIASSLSKKNIELTFTDDKRMHQINLDCRGIDRSTDVLSFPIEDFANAPLGEIVINLERALEDANKYGHSLEDEVALLFIHGVLHLLGYDHETDDGQMREKEKRLIEEFGLADSLIIRSENDS